VCAALCISAVVSASAADKKTKPAPKTPPRKLHLDAAYFNGEIVKVHPAAVERGEKVLVVGPWNMGPKVAPKPSDKRPNMYFVVPGTLHQIVGYPEYDHTEILSYSPEDPKEFDVYWAVVLDPDLTQEFTAEAELIMARQQTFVPGADFTFDKIPSAPFLKKMLKISNLSGLDKYKNSDGSFPRLAIITAGFAVRFSTEKPEEKPADQQSAEAPQPQN
jgi:hypothetical protein